MVTAPLSDPASLGGYKFADVFRMYSHGMMTPHATIAAISSWLGAGWTVERCMEILHAEPWIEKGLGERHSTKGLGLNPLGIVMLVMHSGEHVSPEIKSMAADMALGWCQKRTQAAKAWG